MLKHLFFFAVLLCGSTAVFAQSQTFSSSGTFTAPAGVTSVVVECWGGGGAGGGNSSSSDGGGGGGGGAYSKATISVTPGSGYTVNVGNGASGGSGSGSAGGDSYFINSSTVMAKGGAGGAAVSGGNPGNGGAGGSSTSSVGTTKFSGGSGGTGRNNSNGQGGPGGSSAGTAAVGTSGAGTWSTVTAAAAPSGGGIGGNGGTSGNDGSNGTVPGGGGGGAGDNTASGGDGAKGQVVITWTCSNTLTSGAGTNIQSVCKSSPITNITYALVGATGANVTGLPTGVTGSYSSGTVTISGSPSVSGTFNYTVTPTGSCTSSTATGTITVNAPTANAGSALSNICQGGTSAALGGSVGGTATGGTWSDGALGGSFNPNATTLNATYTPLSTYTGTVVLTLTTSGGACGTTTASKNLNVVAQPVATGSGGSQTICVGGTATVSGITAANGTISWSENGAGSITSGGTTTTPTYTSQAGDAGNTVTLTMTVSGSPCTAATATYSVVVNPLPSVSVSPSAPNVCAGSGVSLTASGASTYSWSPAGSLNVSTGATVIASPSVSTTYTVTGTNANGCINTNTAAVTVISAPSAVSVTPSSTTICPGGNVSLTASGGSINSNYTSGTGSSTTTSNTSTSTLGPNPLQNYYGGSKQQTMWRSSELISLGLVNGSKINSITINLAAAGTTYALLNYRIKYQLSSSVTALSTTPITTGWTTIYGPQSYTPVSGINTFTFSSPIVWDGTSSLILEFNFSNNNTGSTGTLNTATFNSGLSYTATNFYRSDNVTAATVDAFSSTVNFSYSSRNNVQFNVTQPVSYSWLPVTGLNVSTGTTVVASPASSTTYTVSGTLANGCSSTATSSVSINPAISISFTSSNVSCNGGTNGSATANATGGNGSFVSYLWSNGQTTATATGLIAGTYSVTVTDGLGCTASNSVVITQPSSLVASCSVLSNVSCNGGTDGSASVSASGGTAPYSGEGTFTGLAAGTYSYTVTDANGCTASCSVTISEPAALVATCSVVSNVSCNGLADGSASVSAAGGTAPYSGTGSFTGLAAGTYSYTVTDANGCTASCSVTITEPAVLVATCSVVSNVTCNGATDGSASVSATGGTSPYSGTGSFTGLAAGTYSYTVTDANGCTASCSVTITEPSALSASCTWVSDVTCHGGSDGSASVSATGGTGPYTGTGLVSGLSAGTQTLTVSDANGCTATCTVVITEPSALVATCSVVTNVTCNGGTDGSASVSASGGVAPYSGEGTFTGLAAGTYSYTVTDANGCTASCSVTISEPAALVATCSVVSNVSCNGLADGSASVSASGGTAPYSGTGSFTGLAAGTYNYTVTDANGCTASCSVTISEPAALVATCSVVSNVSCNGGSDGSASVSASGGTAPYSGDGTFTGLAAGTYSYTVTDANGCTASCSVTITEPSALSASCTWVSDVTCNGGNNGSATVSATGGTGPYTGTGLVSGLSAGSQTLTVTDANGCTATCTVVISEPSALVATCSVVSNVTCNGGTDGSASVSASGGTAPYSGDGTFTGLAAGTYSYTVTDANGCTASCSVTISEPAALVATCTVVSNVSCNGGSDGAFNVSASGGTGPYTGTGGYAGAVAGTNNITVTDANGCTATCSVTITEPAVLVATCSVVSNVSCNGGTDGSASVSASGGTAPYSGDGTFTGLAAGTYSYTVTDANGCTASCSVTITEPSALSASCTWVSDVTCNGGNNGSATVSATGGTGPYTGTGLVSGLSAGSQTLTVTDANGCTATCTVVISEPSALVATCSVVSNVTCNGGTDGSASVSASGGTAPYSGDGTFTGLAAGTYSYTVTDANGCTASCSVTISEPAALVATCTVVSNVSCNGGSDGAFNVSASGGTGPYTGTGGYAGAVAGTNNITVTDANGCTATCSVTITEPAVLVATCSVVSNVSCNGGTDGSASVSASGGTAPYSGDGTFTGLAAGTYSYTVTDANGCTASCSVTISEPAALVATCSVVSNVTCNGGTDGSASVSASGGTAPYSGDGTFTGLAAGTYSYTVTDANGCTASCSVTISEPAALVATCSVVSNVTCNGGTDGSASVSASGGVTPYSGEGTFTGLAAGTYSYTVTDANGCTASCSVTISEPAALVATCTVVSNVSCNGGSDGAFNVSASGGTGPYTGTGVYAGAVAGTNNITVTDANGCTATCSVTITEPAVLVATCSVVSNVSCNGGTDGSASVSASGGTGPYSGDGTFTGLAAGTYSYTVTDANGCTASCSVTISEPAALVATCSVVSNVTCNGGTDGSASVSASGGTAPYSGDGTFTGLAAGTYNYTVTDANGCTASCSVTISEPAALVATCSVVSNVTCNGGTDGSASVSASGGVTPYSGEGTFTGLAGGTYNYTVTDANGCTASCSVTISEPAALVATCTVVSNVSCNGGSDGAFNVSASGGTGPYTGTGVYAGAVAGTNNITVTDANGCTATCSVTITEPAVLVATCSVVSNVSCSGGTDGSASVSASGGTGPYSGTGLFAGLAAGTYNYTVTDANGCTASCSVTISEPSALVATCSVVSNVTCNGGTDGSASVSASGGTAPYSGDGTFTGLAAGTYNYTVTDANGCTASCSVTISEPAALVATCSVVSNVTCNGGTDGSASVSASGGTAPYSGEGTFTGLAAGTYSYTVTDANGCTASCSVTISEPAALVATCTVVSNVSCNGGSDGAFNVSASGGTGPYTGTGGYAGAVAGTNNITVTDANGCTATCSVTITEPAVLVATCSVVSNVSCNGGTDGSASVSASGGTGPYSGDGTFTGLAAGTYNYTVTDANGCTASCSVTISEPAALVATCSVVSNVTCNGGTDGSASVSASGGTAPYSGDGTFTGLAAGTYNYTVTDANGCTASCSVTISEPAALVATCSVVSNVTCNGGTDGSASVSASGGTAPYSGEGTFTGLAAGTYNYTVTDANGCTASCSVTISEPAALVATCTVVSNVSCNGGSDGAFNVSASGGTGPYTGTGVYAGAVAGTNNITVTDANGCTATCSVTITEPAVLVATCSVVSNVSCNGGTDGSASVSASGGTAPYSGDGTFTGLAAGTYSYTVTDANGCTASCSVTISEPAALVATCSVVSNVTCNGGTDGSASVSASGGTAPYSGDGTFTGLAAGTYSYTVTDANGCTASCSVTISEPAALVATCSVVSNVTCNGGTDGSASVSASGGTAPYSGEGTFTGLAAGTYSYTVTDANGCTASCSVTISEPAALVATCTVVSNVSCNGGSDGAFNVSASGGTGPYTGTGVYAGAVAGTNNITVTDANGCTATCSVTITEPAVLVATCSVVSNVSCNGGTDGSASVSASGGTGPYSGDGTFTGLAAGTYNYTVTDANGCTASCSVTISEPAALVATCSVVSNVTCNGGTDGSASVSASGGTAPYSGDGTFTGLAAGTYNYTVTDANGCTASCSVTISEPAALVATCSVVSNVTCNGGTDGSASVSASGGTSPYSGEGTFTGLAAGTYSYTVTDANGCTASCSVTISEPAVLVAACTVVSNVTCNGGTDGSASVSASGGTAPYSGDGTFTGLAAGTYSYTVTDANGCTALCSVTISEPTVLSIVCTPTNETYPGANNGSVSILATGGTAPYSNDGLHSGLAAGTYTYTVTDANGCTTSCTTTVGTDCVPSVDPSGATASASEICLGSNVTLTVSGGSLGTGADWVWYEGGCGAGTPIGTGVSISVPVTTLGTHNYFVRAEGLCGTTICASVSVNGITVLPAPITILSAPVSGCIGGSGTVTCSTVAGATSYQWTAPSGVLINGVAGPVITASTTVTVTFTALPPTGISGWNICVSGINACGTSPNTKCYWIRATISTPSPIVGSVVGCPSTNGSYSVTPVDGAAQYVWTVTGTAGLNGGGATVTTTVPNVTINFGSGFTTGQLCVYAKTSCGYSGASRCLSIATAPGLPGAISGSTTICPGSSSTYSITPVAGAASYLWTTTGAGVSVVGSGTSATVTTTSAFTSGSVCVVAVSACGSPIGNSAQRCKTIGTGKLATPGNITGDPTTGVCGQTYQYSIPSIAGATGGYLWSIPSGVTVIGPSNSNSITLQFPSNFVSGTICANGINACGNGFTRCVNVFGNPGTPTAISGNASVCAGSTEVYTWPSVPGATSYQVIVPAGSVILTGSPTVNTMAVITWGTTAGSIGVKAINGCGVSGTRTLPVAISCRTAQTVNESNDIQATIYPNPAHGSFNVSFTTKTADNFNLKVVDQTGRIVKAQQINAVEGVNLQQLDASDLAPGVYLVVLESKSGISKYPLMLQ